MGREMIKGRGKTRTLKAFNAIAMGCAIILLLFSAATMKGTGTFMYILPCVISALLVFLIITLILSKRGGFSYEKEATSAFLPMLLVVSLNILVKIALTYGTTEKYDFLFFAIPLVTSAICVLVYNAAKRIFNRRTAILAALLYAFAPAFPISQLNELKTTLSAAIVCLALVFALSEKRTVPKGLFTGVLLFAACFLDETSILAVPGILIYNLITPSGKKEKNRFWKNWTFLFTFIALFTTYAAFMSFTEGSIHTPMGAGFSLHLNFAEGKPVLESLKGLIREWEDSLIIFAQASSPSKWVIYYRMSFYIFFLICSLKGMFIAGKTVKKETAPFSVFIFFCFLTTLLVMRSDAKVTGDLFFAMLSFLSAFGLMGEVEYVPLSVEVQKERQYVRVKNPKIMIAGDYTGIRSKAEDIPEEDDIEKTVDNGENEKSEDVNGSGSEQERETETAPKREPLRFSVKSAGREAEKKIRIAVWQWNVHKIKMPEE